MKYSFLAIALLVLGLSSCSTLPPPVTRAPVPIEEPAAPPPPLPGGGMTMQQPKSLWVAVAWDQLPGWQVDEVAQIWPVLLQNCQRPPAQWARLCPQLRRLTLADTATQWQWLQESLQPYQVQSLDGQSKGLLTAYYEPQFEAAREPDAQFRFPLYRLPAGLKPRQPYFTRQELDTVPQAQEALRGREIAYLTDPIDVLILQIQGSGQLNVRERDGTQQRVRLAYAASNEQPYQSVGRWLQERAALRDVSWPSIKAWVANNPDRVNEMLWSNPRVIFFREEAFNAVETPGPKGAQGVSLTAGRSIAVDRQSIPYGTLVWLASIGPAASLQKLVVAQDTGSAIVGAVRADYFVGAGAAAGDIAGRIKQPLQLWAFWPK